MRRRVFSSRMVKILRNFIVRSGRVPAVQNFVLVEPDAGAVGERARGCVGRLVEVRRDTRYVPDMCGEPD